THRRASTPKVRRKKARPQLRYRPLMPSWRTGRSTRLRTDFATQADVATHRVHDKGAEIVCGFEREAVLAPFDCVCGGCDCTAPHHELLCPIPRYIAALSCTADSSRS